MKQNTFLPTLRKAATGLAAAAALLFTIGSTDATAQPCLTDHLVINTGYNPNSGSAIAAGANDPRWNVTYISPDVSAAIGGPGTPYAAISKGTPAYSWIGNTTTSTWISVNSAADYATNAAGTYEHTYTRTFRMCEGDEIDFELNIANDNYCSGIRVDGVPVPPGTPFSQTPGTTTSNYTAFTTIPTFTMGLAAGTHTIEVDIVNFAVASWSNPTGLHLIGDLFSPNNVLVVETANCERFRCCDASFTYCLDVNNPFTINLSANTTTQPGTYNWTVDGSWVGSGTTFSYTFPTGGSHKVCLEYMTPDGGLCDMRCIDICFPDTKGDDGNSDGNGNPGGNGRIKLGGEPGTPFERIYPNPVQTELNVEINNDMGGDADVVIYDVAGQTMLTQKLHIEDGVRLFSVPTGKLAPGVYFISISNGNATLKEKFVKK